MDCTKVRGVRDYIRHAANSVGRWSYQKNLNPPLKFIFKFCAKKPKYRENIFVRKACCCYLHTQVKWSRENYHHDLATPYTLRLASADHNGRIIVWDVAQASIRAEFSDGSKPVAGMFIVFTCDVRCRDSVSNVQCPILAFRRENAYSI